MKKQNSLLLIFVAICSLASFPNLYGHDQNPIVVMPVEHELNRFLDEFVWVTLDNSKLNLSERSKFNAYAKNKDYGYRGYLKKIGRYGIILKRKVLPSEPRRTEKEETWIPFTSILSISMIDERSLD